MSMLPVGYQLNERDMTHSYISGHKKKKQLNGTASLQDQHNFKSFKMPVKENFFEELVC